MVEANTGNYGVTKQSNISKMLKLVGKKCPMVSITHKSPTDTSHEPISSRQGRSQ